MTGTPCRQQSPRRTWRVAVTWDSSVVGSPGHHSTRHALLDFFSNNPTSHREGHIPQQPLDSLRDKTKYIRCCFSLTISKENSWTIITIWSYQPSISDRVNFINCRLSANNFEKNWSAWYFLMNKIYYNKEVPFLLAHPYWCIYGRNELKLMCDFWVDSILNTRYQSVRR